MSYLRIYVEASFLFPDLGPTHVYLSKVANIFFGRAKVPFRRDDALSVTLSAIDK